MASPCALLVPLTERCFEGEEWTPSPSDMFSETDLVQALRVCVYCLESTSLSGNPCDAAASASVCDVAESAATLKRPQTWSLWQSRGDERDPPCPSDAMPVCS